MTSTEPTQYERNMRDLATLAARWSADLRVELLPLGSWSVRVVARRGSTIAGGFAVTTFALAVSECLADLRRVTAEEDAREAAADVAS